MGSRITASLLAAAIAGGAAFLPPPAAWAQGCAEQLATAEERLADSQLREQERREIGHMLESARMFLALEREEACMNMLLEAEQIASEIASTPVIEEQAAEELGRPTAGDAAAAPAEEPVYRLIGRPIVADGPEPVGEVVDVVVPENGEGVAVAVLRLGGPLDEDSRTVKVELDRLERDEFQRLRVIGVSAEELRQLPEYDPQSPSLPAD
jgi:hypothetical protein